MDYYPDHYPPSPVTSDGSQYKSDTNNESELDDIRFGSKIDDGLVKISDDSDE